MKMEEEIYLTSSPLSLQIRAPPLLLAAAVEPSSGSCWLAAARPCRAAMPLLPLSHQLGSPTEKFLLLPRARIVQVSVAKSNFGRRVILMQRSWMDPTVCISLFIAKAGYIATKETFEWVLSEPKIIKASSVICRLMDDVSSHKFEQKRGHVASAIEFYIKQHDATEEKVRAEFNKQVTDAWKVINQECLQPTAIPMPLLTCVLNYARVADVMYKDGDAYTFAQILLKDHLSALFINTIAM